MNDITLCITVHSVASSTLRNAPKSQAFYKTLSGKHAVIIPWKNVYFNNDIYIFFHILLYLQQNYYGKSVIFLSKLRTNKTATHINPP